MKLLVVSIYIDIKTKADRARVRETMEGETRKRKALTAIEWSRRAITAMEKKRKALTATEREIEMNSLSWRRGRMLGRGAFGMVSLAFFFKKEEPCPNQFPLYTAAVKSSLASQSSTLKEEALILSELRGSTHIIHCLGDELTMENDEAIYNVFLEYISGGTLADRIKSTISGLQESHVRNYTTSIVRGLSYIHGRGYVHCDINPHNLLLCSALEVKIADFGLAKKLGEKVGFGQCGFRGTPLYLAPESALDAEYEPAADIWALGCVVVEMFTGKTAWEHPVDGNVFALLFRIGFSQRLPKIPAWLSEEGKDFLRKCLVRDPQKRWTADMLLQHPFIVGKVIGEECLKPLDIELPVLSKTAIEVPHPSGELQLNCKSKRPATVMIEKASKTGHASPGFQPLDSSSVMVGEETPTFPDFIPLAASSATTEETSGARQKTDDFIPLSVSSTTVAAAGISESISESLCRPYFPFLPFSIMMGEENSTSPDVIPFATSSAMMEETSGARQKTNDFIPLLVSSTTSVAA